MPKKEVQPSGAIYPVPVVLVSSLDRDANRGNIITLAWCGIVSSLPPTISVSIRPSRYSHKLITAEREFVINIPAKDILRKVDLCGMVSGSDSDKADRCGFTMINASRISSPMIKDCPVNLECRVKDIIKLGSHDMFIAEVVAVHYDSEILDNAGKIDFKKAKPFVLNHGEYWDLGKMIGNYGFSSE